MAIPPPKQNSKVPGTLKKLPGMQHGIRGFTPDGYYKKGPRKQRVVKKPRKKTSNRRGRTANGVDGGLGQVTPGSGQASEAGMNEETAFPTVPSPFPGTNGIVTVTAPDTTLSTIVPGTSMSDSLQFEFGPGAPGPVNATPLREYTPTGSYVHEEPQRPPTTLSQPWGNHSQYPVLAIQHTDSRSPYPWSSVALSRPLLGFDDNRLASQGETIPSQSTFPPSDQVWIAHNALELSFGHSAGVPGLTRHLTGQNYYDQESSFESYPSTRYDESHASGAHSVPPNGVALTSMQNLGLFFTYYPSPPDIQATGPTHPQASALEPLSPVSAPASSSQAATSTLEGSAVLSDNDYIPSTTAMGWSIFGDSAHSLTPLELSQWMEAYGGYRY